MTHAKKRALALLFALTLILVVAITAFAGVTATVSNHSGETIDRISLAHERGTMTMGPLRPHVQASERLGKIGEGASFELVAQQGRTCFGTTFDVYFFDLSPFVSLHVQLLNNKRVRVLEGGRTAVEATLRELAACSR